MHTCCRCCGDLAAAERVSPALTLSGVGVEAGVNGAANAVATTLATENKMRKMALMQRTASDVQAAVRDRQMTTTTHQIAHQPL